MTHISLIGAKMTSAGFYSENCRRIRWYLDLPFPTLLKKKEKCKKFDRETESRHPDISLKILRKLRL